MMEELGNVRGGGTGCAQGSHSVIVVAYQKNNVRYTFTDVRGTLLSTERAGGKKRELSETLL